VQAGAERVIRRVDHLLDDRCVPRSAGIALANVSAYAPTTHCSASTPACSSACGLSDGLHMIAPRPGEQGRLGGLGLAGQVVDASPRGRQGLAGDAVVVAAQEQID
jgi:hypothetical protein